LDRPNPINGLDTDGPVLDSDMLSFTGYMPMPTRHGMTVGELAMMFNTENKIGARLEVVKMEGWERSAWYDQTSLLWINPSPNMTGMDAAVLYPGIGIIEASVSVGRGTNSPFEKVGAPYIDPVAFARVLNNQGLEGVRFAPIRFTPAPPGFPHQNEDCGGVQIITTDRTRMRPVAVGIAMASTLYRMYPTQYPLDRILPLLGDRAVLQAIRSGASLDRILGIWQAELQQFRRIRQNYLLY
ncbi:MAG: DUF1343 domain-containing protein, partial [Acidobacteria bacterium]|nr:DUF1343 domain-containing protein [Acidobacteriota bacterium]